MSSGQLKVTVCPTEFVLTSVRQRHQQFRPRAGLNLLCSPQHIECGSVLSRSQQELSQQNCIVDSFWLHRKHLVQKTLGLGSPTHSAVGLSKPREPVERGRTQAKTSTVRIRRQLQFPVEPRGISQKEPELGFAWCCLRSTLRIVHCNCIIPVFQGQFHSSCKTCVLNIRSPA